MTNLPDFITENNARLEPERIKRVLIVYNDNEFYLGDNCIIFYRLGLCRHFFGNDAVMDINFVNSSYFERYHDLCRNNPCFSEVICGDFREVDFNAYELLLFISPDELPFVESLYNLYAHANRKPSFAALSFSKAVFARRKSIKEPIFPFFEDLLRYAITSTDRPYELYISSSEKEWGNKWLEENGVDEGDDVFIVADYTSKRNKLLRPDVYQRVLMYLLGKENSRILIFDEMNMGKEQFYRQWLSDEYMDRFIFAKGLSLRKAFCLASSDHIKLIFGPCTGLLHCASAIYNKFLRDGMDASKIPVMITYTGPWDAYYWWKNSPLVNCLLLRNIAGKKKMADLHELNEDEKREWEHRMQCSEYTGAMITEFMETRLSLAGESSRRSLSFPI